MAGLNSTQQSIVNALSLGALLEGPVRGGTRFRLHGLRYELHGHQPDRYFNKKTVESLVKMGRLELRPSTGEYRYEGHLL